ncbi:MAG: amidohydrolase family protein [Variibacter sp.]|nr:amidohydrolase family protein [Variibacter sp.]
MTKSIDVHAHIIPEPVFGLLAKESARVAPKFATQPDGSMIMSINDKVVQNPMPREIFDVDMRLRDMDAHNVDMQVLSNNTALFFYHEDAALAATCAAMQNDEIAAVVAKHPTRFVGLATLPLQDARRSADELRRAMKKLNLRGVHVGTSINDMNLDDPSLEPVWATANELGAFILVHPYGPGLPGSRLNNYYMRNFVLLPFETTIAGASLVFGGVLDRYPNITFCLCHGGGYVPYQAGRFVHAWNVRPEARINVKSAPEKSIARLYYDTITHSKPALEFLVQQATPEHVLLGSDYPFDMGNLDCVALVQATSLPPSTQEIMLSGSAKKLLRLG